MGPAPRGLRRQATGLSIAAKAGASETLHVNGELVLSQGGKLAAIQNVRARGNLGRGYNDDSFFPGDIAEVLVYTRALPDAERVQHEAYLAERYGLR